MNILVIVDVQKQFNKFIQHDLVEEISKYAESFDKVYQIWDTHNATGPSESFPNEVDTIPKKFGKNHFSKKVKEFIKRAQDSTEEGKLFKLSENDGYIVRVENNHDWFYVNPEIVKLIDNLKGNKVILVGGAFNECIEDVFQAFLAFGIDVEFNKKYTYDAETTQQDSVKECLKVIKFKDFR